MTPALLIGLADDSADFRHLVQDLFTQYLPQHTLLLVDSGPALLAALPSLPQKPNLILLDQQMPDWDGLQTLLALKRNGAWAAIPVVLISSDASHSEISRGYEAGAHAFLVKPLGAGRLREMINEALTYASKPLWPASQSESSAGA